MGERRIDFKLYLITDRKLFPDNDSFLSALEAALKGGVSALQLREKDLPAGELLAMAYRIRRLASKYSAKFFVNDRIDVALCSGADGVHLGQAGIPVCAARKTAGDLLLVGVSTHSLREARLAEEERADFITFGPLYRTPSKLKFGSPVGLAGLKKVTEQISIPVFGIGGIGHDAVNAVMKCGADGVAVIRGILGGADARTAAEQYINILGNRQ